MICITSEPIDFCKILVDIMDKSSGSTILFVGTVRDHNDSKAVFELHYETYKEMAEKNLAEIENEAKMKWNINNFVAIHRTGNLKVGEVSVAVAASAEHRNQAFEACRYGIDQIKTKVPVWKKEVYKNGAHWVNGISLEKSDHYDRKHV
jgi:molybdopterin synthase catalytic subunit